MSRHNPDTAAYEKTILGLESRLRSCWQLVEGYLDLHGIEHCAATGLASTRCLCCLCVRARTMLGKG